MVEWAYENVCAAMSILLRTNNSTHKHYSIKTTEVQLGQVLR